MASTEARAGLERLFAERKPADRPLGQRRREWEEDVRGHILPQGARPRHETIAGVAAEWMEVPGPDTGTVFLLLHGGGYVNGSPLTHRRLAAHLGVATGMAVLTPDYRLAPEHPFPAGVEDALAVYRELLARGFDASHIVVGGDSAGGGLTLSMLLALRAAGGPMPQAAVLLAPWTDLTVSSPSYEANKDRDPIISREALLECAGWYAGGGDPADPAMSPLFADLRGLPPMLIHAASDEAMVDDSRLLAERARAAGIEVSCTIFEGLWHVFHASGIEIPESRQAIDEIGNYLKALQGE